MGIKIMIIDDEHDLVTMLKFVFAKFGYEVLTAYNGKEALDILSGNSTNAQGIIPDIIVADVMMPIIDGYTLVAQLQENDETKKIPVIIMTAKGQTRELFQGNSNVVDFIEKPFEPKKLKNIIEKALEK